MGEVLYDIKLLKCEHVDETIVFLSFVNCKYGREKFSFAPGPTCSVTSHHCVHERVTSRQLVNYGDPKSHNFITFISALHLEG
jgi:hypothetical protein